MEICCESRYNKARHDQVTVFNEGGNRYVNQTQGTGYPAQEPGTSQQEGAYLDRFRHCRSDRRRLTDYYLPLRVIIY